MENITKKIEDQLKTISENSWIIISKNYGILATGIDQSDVLKNAAETGVQPNEWIILQYPKDTKDLITVVNLIKFYSSILYKVSVESDLNKENLLCTTPI